MVAEQWCARPGISNLNQGTLGPNPTESESRPKCSESRFESGFGFTHHWCIGLNSTTLEWKILLGMGAMDSIFKCCNIFITLTKLGFILPLHHELILIKVILWCILSYLNRISLLKEYPVMLINNMVKLVQGEVSKRPGNVFTSWTAIGSP